MSWQLNWDISIYLEICHFIGNFIHKEFCKTIRDAIKQSYRSFRMNDFNSLHKRNHQWKIIVMQNGIQVACSSIRELVCLLPPGQYLIFHHKLGVARKFSAKFSHGANENWRIKDFVSCQGASEAKLNRNLNVEFDLPSFKFLMHFKRISREKNESTVAVIYSNETRERGHWCLPSHLQFHRFMLLSKE